MMPKAQSLHAGQLVVTVTVLVAVAVAGADALCGATTR